MAVDTLSGAFGGATRKSRSYNLGTPLVLAAALVLLYLWLSTQQLDSMEARVLSAASIRDATLAHLTLTAISTSIVVVIAIPIGVLLTRPFARWLTPWVMAVANVGQAAPALGVLVLLSILFGIGTKIAIVTLVFHATLPVLRNTIAGIQQVDSALLEAGRGMGMSRRQILRRLELPLAVPVVMAGLRTTIVICVGIATVATFINAGGLGDIVVAGIKLQRTSILVTGGVLTAVIALGLDWLAGLAEKYVRPQGI
ncbi:ABC transporter permease [Nonomuraea lactucae]|uniref:ABC transporter permease n=1 Tax=Nonomuraea lactucae TaxID=2249762 RepID=UPI000DE337B0|nr:ABC transporter permease [Nonomuraea lactucae]